LEVSRSVVCRHLKRKDVPPEKRDGECQRARRVGHRAAWRVSVAEVLEPERLVFVDEMGLHTSLAPLYGYAPKGERLRLSVLRNRGRNSTLLSSMTTEGMGASMAVEGATTREVFENPRAFAGEEIVVMDNLGAHRPKRVRELIQARGCELLYLPAYSPDLNPIEEALSKIKHILRKIAARTKETLIEAMGRALAAVSAQDVRGFFVNCGYRTPAQQL
jgi:transposase